MYNFLIFCRNFIKFYTCSLLIDFYQIPKKDNSCSILEHFNSKVDTLNPQSPLKVQKRWPTATYFKIVLFTTYSNPQSKGWSPVKLKGYRGKCISTPTPKKSLTLWSFGLKSFSDQFSSDQICSRNAHVFLILKSKELFAAFKKEFNHKNFRYFTLQMNIVNELNM